MNKLEDFKQLWTLEKDKSYIEILDGMFCVMDKNNKMLLVEDDELYTEIVETMINNGVKVVERNNTTGELRLVSLHEAMQSFRLFQDNNKEVKIKIIWKKNVSIQKQLYSLKKYCKTLSQMPAVELYKIIKDNDVEWEFTKMRFEDAKKWVDRVRGQGLNVEIVK